MSDATPSAPRGISGDGAPHATTGADSELLARLAP